jgi:ABC-type Zn2+ transport system substrate-binding protein/surface adhesin
MADNDWQTRIKTGRNDECPCGSKKKYKKCHMEADQAAQSAALSKTNADAAAKAEHDHDHEGHDHSHHGHEHAHRHEKGGPARPNTSTNTSRQISAPRKVGGG